MACKIFYKGNTFDNIEALRTAIEIDASLQEVNQLAVIGNKMLQEERLLIAAVPVTTQKIVLTNLANRIYHNL